MVKEDEREKKINRITKKICQLDDICGSIYLPLILNKSLRYNEFYRSVIKLNPKQPSGKPFVSRPSFDEHLGHLINLKLVTKKALGKQNVVYSLNKDALSIFSENPSGVKDIEEWINRINSMGTILEPFDAKRYYEKMSDARLEEQILKEIKEVLKVNLNELKSFINYDLKLHDSESDSEFWRFVGNPLYRMLEKGLAENCKASGRYKKKLFEKIQSLLDDQNSLGLEE
jgi:hypothetical protein